MPPLQSFFTLNGFLRALSLRVRLTSRYLELLLDSSRNEFALPQPEVQQDWADNVEALRWLAGPIYRLTAAFRANCENTDIRMQLELRRQEGRLKAFHGLLLDLHKAYKPDQAVLSDKDESVLRQRHQHLRMNLDFLIGVCNAWLEEIPGSADFSSGPDDQQTSGESFFAFWDTLTSMADVPPLFHDLGSQVKKVNRLANELAARLADSADTESHKKLVLSLCMETRRLLLVLVFHLLTVRPAACNQLRAAQDALKAAEEAANRMQDPTADANVQTSIQLLSRRYQILVQLTNAEDRGHGHCLQTLQQTSLPQLAELQAA